jgi:ferredoxin-NADP reductase
MIAPGVYEIIYTKPDGFTFKAGQFALFDIPLATNPTDIQTRAYSIASSPDEPDLLFVIKLLKGGRASQWVENILAVGTQVRIQGPLGVFALHLEAKQHLLIATGSGVAPFRSQITMALKTLAPPPSMHLVFGVCRSQDLFWTEYFQDLAKKFPSFRYTPVVLTPDDQWKGTCGNIATMLPKLLDRPTETMIAVCGAPDLVKELKKTCIETLGVPKENFHAEGF